MAKVIVKLKRVFFKRGRRNAGWVIVINVILLIYYLQMLWIDENVYNKQFKVQSLAELGVKREDTGHAPGDRIDDRYATEQPKNDADDGLNDVHILKDSQDRTCSLVSPIKIPNPKLVSDMSDWSLTQRHQCGDFAINDLPQKHQQMFSLDCEADQHIPADSDGIFTVNFGEKCLSDYIDKCCRDTNPVPNIIHYVWFGTKPLSFFNFLSLMSSLRFQKPCLILIHGPTIPHGTYWDYFLSLSANIVHVYRESPTKVFENTLRFKEHASDVMRIEALINYGGIYLDFDELILRSLHPLRRYNHTQGHEMHFTMGSQLVMSMKNCTFLQLWYQSYRDNYKKIWAFNALWVPNGLAKKHPELIHVEGYNFTRPSWKNVNDIYNNNYDWSTNYGMHMYARWYKRPIDVNIIRTLNTTIGSVSRHILFGNKELCTT